MIDHVVTYATTVLSPILLLILGNINTMVVVVYQVEPNHQHPIAEPDGKLTMA